MKVVIKMTNSDGASKHFNIIGHKDILIGRGDGCTIKISDDYCSTQHCSIRIENSYLIVKDLDSKNGTFINENAISESYLYIGDKLRIGNHLMSIHAAKMDSADVERLTFKGKQIDGAYISINKNEKQVAPAMNLEVEKKVYQKSHFDDAIKKRQEEKAEHTKQSGSLLSRLFKKK